MMHGLILRDDGACARCAKEHEKLSARKAVKRLAAAALGCLFVLVSYRVVSVAIDMAGAARRGSSSSSGVATRSVGGASSESRLVVYTTGSCPACRMAKAWMNEHAVAYEERRVDSDEGARRELQSLGKGNGVPTFVVDGDDVLVGFDARGVRLTRSLEQHGLK